MLALMIVTADAQPIDWLKPLLIGLGIVFTWIAWRFWFHIPMYGCAAATALMFGGWALR